MSMSLRREEGSNVEAWEHGLARNSSNSSMILQQVAAPEWSSIPQTAPAVQYGPEHGIDAAPAHDQGEPRLASEAAPGEPRRAPSSPPLRARSPGDIPVDQLVILQGSRASSSAPVSSPTGARQEERVPYRAAQPSQSSVLCLGRVQGSQRGQITQQDHQQQRQLPQQQREGDSPSQQEVEQKQWEQEQHSPQSALLASENELERSQQTQYEEQQQDQQQQQKDVAKPHSHFRQPVMQKPITVSHLPEADVDARPQQMSFPKVIYTGASASGTASYSSATAPWSSPEVLESIDLVSQLADPRNWRPRVVKQQILVLGADQASNNRAGLPIDRQGRSSSRPITPATPPLRTRSPSPAGQVQPAPSARLQILPAEPSRLQIVSRQPSLTWTPTPSWTPTLPPEQLPAEPLLMTTSTLSSEQFSKTVPTQKFLSPSVANSVRLAPVSHSQTAPAQRPQSTSQAKGYSFSPLQCSKIVSTLRSVSPSQEGVRKLSPEISSKRIATTSVILQARSLSPKSLSPKRGSLSSLASQPQLQAQHTIKVRGGISEIRGRDLGPVISTNKPRSLSPNDRSRIVQVGVPRGWSPSNRSRVPQGTDVIPSSYRRGARSIPAQLAASSPPPYQPLRRDTLHLTASTERIYETPRFAASVPTGVPVMEPPPLLHKDVPSVLMDPPGPFARGPSIREELLHGPREPQRWHSASDPLDDARQLTWEWDVEQHAQAQHHRGIGIAAFEAELRDFEDHPSTGGGWPWPSTRTGTTRHFPTEPDMLV